MSEPFDKGQRKQAPPLEGRGKGWGLSVEKLDALHERARQMRRNPTDPEKRLWRHLSNGQLGGFKFRRQEVIGGHIADFACPRKSLIVEVDGWTHDDEMADARRDAALAALGYHVVRVGNADVMANMDGVLAQILAALRGLPDRHDSPHPNPPWRGGA